MFTFLNSRRTRDFAGCVNAQDPQIFDLLQMSRLEKSYRDDFKSKRKTFKNQILAHGKKPGPLSVCLKLERIFLERQMQDSALIYLFIKRERKALFRHYFESLKVVNDNKPSPYIFLS